MNLWMLGMQRKKIRPFVVMSNGFIIASRMKMITSFSGEVADK